MPCGQRVSHCPAFLSPNFFFRSFRIVKATIWLSSPCPPHTPPPPVRSPHFPHPPPTPLSHCTMYESTARSEHSPQPASPRPCPFAPHPLNITPSPFCHPPPLIRLIPLAHTRPAVLIAFSVDLPETLFQPPVSGPPTVTHNCDGVISFHGRCFPVPNPPVPLSFMHDRLWSPAFSGRLRSTYFLF